ncbi:MULTISPECIES: PH domain-containing protein [Streptomyces]|uniref:PH domain-containing protein n=1 Tax=Streptomyces TaxID=1883 RepID=UPI00345C0FB5
MTVWSRTVVAGWMVALGAVSAVGFVVAGVLVAGQLALFLWLLVASAALAITGAVRVTVTDRGVTVHSVVLPLVRRRIPHSRIREASAKQSRPQELGGWGYRWLPGQTAVSLRAGDTLWLELASGKFFVVTVDDAAEAAALVNDYVMRTADK